MVTVPYVDEPIDSHSWIRTFDPAVTNSEEYIWHMDKKDRTIQVLDGQGWKFQFDNKLPFIINKGDIIEIKCMSYHRLIPNNSKLRIKINEKL